MTVQEFTPSQAGIVAAWGQRVTIPPDAWQQVIRGAKTRVDLFGTALGGFTRPAMLELARQKLADGCQFRLLLQSPYSDAAHSMAMQKNEAIDDKILASRVRLREFVQSLTAAERGLLQVRSYPSWMSVMIFRGDDELLVTHFLPWLIVDTSPTLHIRAGDGGVFSSYSTSIQRMWLHADPLDLTADGELPH
jgi:hypothetical protein